MPSYTKKILDKIEDTMDSFGRSVSKKGKRTYQNGRDVYRATDDYLNETPPLEVARRIMARSGKCKDTGLPRGVKYANAPDAKVQASERKARIKIAREGGAAVSSGGLAALSTSLAHPSGGATLPLAKLKYLSAVRVGRHFRQRRHHGRDRGEPAGSARPARAGHSAGDLL